MMRTYAAYIDPAMHSTPADRLASAILVREGFNFWAFLCGPIWALYHRLWLAALWLTVIPFAIGAAGEWAGMGEQTQGLAQIAFGVIVGYLASDMRSRQLVNKGYVLMDIVCAESRLNAELRFLEHHLPAMPHSPASHAAA